MKKEKTTKERGLFKEKINSALYKNEDIKELIIGDISGMTNEKVRELFKDHVKSHLFIDDTIEETGSYIFYDIVVPSLHENTKRCRIIMYVMCHRSILEDYYKEGYYGDRADILSEMVEDTLINNTKVVQDFGIGKLTLTSVVPYNSTKFYGSILEFNSENFR